MNQKKAKACRRFARVSLGLNPTEPRQYVEGRKTLVRREHIVGTKPNGEPDIRVEHFPITGTIRNLRGTFRSQYQRLKRAAKAVAVPRRATLQGA